MREAVVQLAHGSGGRLSRQLVEEIMQPAFDNPYLKPLHDGAQFFVGQGRMAFTTDSFVVKPLFFPGGDIGKLAVCGTVNDLAMNGAVPQYLSAGFIIEEGFPLNQLQQIVASMAATAREAGVFIVTGDTKVVEKGAAEGLYINTSGVGTIPEGICISGQLARPGQDILINGSIGDHSLAVMGQRHGLTLPPSLVSDCAPLSGLVKDVLKAVPQITVLRDPTRGGLATALNEIAEQSGVGILLEEASVPVTSAVQAACDILGFDPFYMANEGKCIVFVESKYTETVLEQMRRHPYGRAAAVIGKVVEESAGQVGLRTTVGGMRLLDVLTGEQLPRIC